MGKRRLGLDLLEYLKPGEWISGEEIAAICGISRAMVWKQIRMLRSKGYRIDSSPNKGYYLAKDQDVLDPDLIIKGLETAFVGRDLRYFHEIESTNRIARDIAGISRNGTVILAEIQMQGRGRLSRPWHSPPGGVWMSLILKPEVPLAKSYLINMAVSVAITRALLGLYNLTPGIKWPNDILINEKKICEIGRAHV
jgi:BirA family transcriptional regulator, biotin operon repressor / biotin---[acetyl-CoA-carboxylase] ligase